MTIIDVKDIDELETLIGGEFNDEYDDEEIVHFEDRDIAVIYEPCYRITVSGVTFIVAEGVYCAWDEEKQETLPDWSISLIYADTSDFNPDNYLYYEQGCPISALRNYINYIEA